MKARATLVMRAPSTLVRTAGRTEARMEARMPGFPQTQDAI
jgi:hypothetical protein